MYWANKLVANILCGLTVIQQVDAALARYPPQVRRIAFLESSFNPKARNGNCLGLMQVNAPIWEKELKAKGIIKRRSDLLKIEPNLKAGYYILQKYNMDYYRYRTGRRKQ